MPALPSPKDRHTLTRYLSRPFLAVMDYHQYRVVGLENIPRQGPGLVLVNHSLASYDILLLGAKVVLELDRLPRALGDRLIFKLPGVREAASAVGVVEGEPKAARELLSQGELLFLSPGGMREALRPSSRRYEIQWGNRRGFARLACDAQVPVILAACPRADDIYTIRPSRLTELAYRHLKIPVPVAFGRGPTLIPRPVELVHYVSEPIMPPPHNDAQAVEALHRELCTRMEALLARRD